MPARREELRRRAWRQRTPTTFILVRAGAEAGGYRGEVFSSILDEDDGRRVAGRHWF